MSSKSTMAILAIGFLGMVAMGLMTKYALDSSPVLAEVTRVKKDLARKLDDHQLESISIRTLPKRRGYALRFIFGEALVAGELEVFAEDLAGEFVDRFKGSRRPEVQIALLRSASFGCGSDEVLIEKTFQTAKLLAKKKLAAAAKALSGLEHPRGHFRVIGAEPSEAGSFLVTVIWSDDSREVDTEEISALVFGRLADAPVQRLHLVVRSPSGSDTVLLEADVDRPSSKRLTPARRRPRPGPGPSR